MKNQTEPTDGMADDLMPRVETALRRLEETQRPRYRRLWAYYANPMVPFANTGTSARPYRQAQEWGLPTRITGVAAGPEIGSGQTIGGIARKEIVIENDLAWRVDTMVDYLFGKPLVIVSAAPDERRRKVLGALLNRILDHHGGIVFLQRLALLGAVYGFVDVLVKLNAGESARADAWTDMGAEDAPPSDVVERLSRRIRLEIVEPARSLPLIDPRDDERMDAYGQAWELPGPEESPSRSTSTARGWIERLREWSWRRESNGRAAAPASRRRVVEIITDRQWWRYEEGTLRAFGRNSLGRIPLAHIQNSALPFSYAGAGDLEGLIPLQDELNTRLCDRAHRIALQSFKMYLGKGIDNFTELPVGPGRMWMTHNDQADVVEFGGDQGCPSEANHIADVREALDKASSVTPVAAGAIKNRIGRLTSAAALRVTLLALLAKTDRKRTTYGRGIERICELSLAWLDRAGLFHTDPAERVIELHWPSPLPENDLEQLQQAEIKTRLGVPKEVVLKELGY